MLPHYLQCWMTAWRYMHSFVRGSRVAKTSNKGASIGTPTWCEFQAQTIMLTVVSLISSIVLPSSFLDGWAQSLAPLLQCSFCLTRLFPLLAVPSSFLYGSEPIHPKLRSIIHLVLYRSWLKTKVSQSWWTFSVNFFLALHVKCTLDRECVCTAALYTLCSTASLTVTVSHLLLFCSLRCTRCSITQI